MAAESKSMPEVLKGFNQAGIPGEAVLSTWKAVQESILLPPGVPQTRFDAALDTLCGIITPQSLAIAVAGMVAAQERSLEAVKDSLRHARFPESYLNRTIVIANQAVGSAIERGEDPIVHAIEAIRRASALIVGETSSFGLREPNLDLKQDLYEYLKRSHNFWARYTNALYDTFKQLEAKPHNKTLDDILNVGPPPRVPDYRGIYFPYRRGRVPATGQKPVPVLPGESYGDFMHINSTMPWLCRGLTNEAIDESVGQLDNIAAGLVNLNSDQRHRDDYLRLLRAVPRIPRELPEEVPKAICRLHMNPGTLKDYEFRKDEKPMGYDGIYRALLEMMSTVLKSPGAPTKFENYCAKLSPKQYSEAQGMSQKYLLDHVHKWGPTQTPRAAFQAAAAYNKPMFVWLRTWAVPVLTCKLNMELKWSTLGKDVKSKYEDAWDQMRELSGLLDNINMNRETCEGLEPAQPGKARYYCDPVPSPTNPTRPPKPTQTWSFEVPKFEFTLPDVCQDWRTGECDGPWTLSHVPTNLRYRENMRAIAKHCIKSMDLFEKQGDRYLDYMLAHADNLDSTLRLIQDVACVIHEVPLASKPFVTDGRRLNTPLFLWCKELEHYLWNTFVPRERYQRTIPKLLKALEETKKKQGP